MKKSLDLSFTYDLDKGIDTYTITEAFQSFINTLEREGVDYKLTATTTAVENDVEGDAHPKSCNCPHCVEIPEAMQDLGPNSSESWEIQKDECGVPLMPEAVVTGIMHPIEFTDGEGVRKVLVGEGEVARASEPSDGVNACQCRVCTYRSMTGLPVPKYACQESLVALTGKQYEAAVEASKAPKPHIVRSDIPINYPLSTIVGVVDQPVATMDLFSDGTARITMGSKYAFEALTDYSFQSFACVVNPAEKNA